MTDIWFHDFQPYIVDNVVKTSAAGGPSVTRQMEMLNHFGISTEFVGTGDSTTSVEFTFDELPKLIYLRWRWEMPHYKARQLSYNRQMWLIDLAFKNDIPVIAHDLDLQEVGKIMGIANAAKTLGKTFVPAMTALLPLEGYESLVVPSPRAITGDWEYDGSHATKENLWTYIGNNYGRTEQMAREWHFKEATIYGNWNEPSPSREPIEEVKKLLPFCTFPGRCDNNEVIPTLAKAFFTMHFARPIYCDTAFMTGRWIEAAIAGTVAFAPSDFTLTDAISSFALGPEQALLVRREDLYKELLEEQRSQIGEVFHDSHWLEFFSRFL